MPPFGRRIAEKNLREERIMQNFTFHSPTRIVFGKDTVDGVGELIKPLAGKVLLHYGSERIVESGLFARVTASLQRAGVEHVALGGVRPNPDVELARRGAQLAREAGAELVLCVGGGSVIDSGKAIAIGMTNPALDLWEIFENGLDTIAAAPLACVLTFPAAGSESSNGSVLSNYVTGRKYGYSRESNRPVLALIDPTLFFSLPRFQIASGLADMMSHIFERYFSNTEHTELVDALAEATLRTMLAFGPVVADDPANYDAWCQIALAGTIAHNNLLGIGREQDWACHKLDHELTAHFGVTHGAGLAVLTPAWMRYVWRANPKRFVDFSTRVMGCEPQPQDAATIEAGVSALEAFYARIGLPHTLAALGVDAAAIPDMTRAALYAPDGSMRQIGALKVLGEADIRAIFERAM